MFYPKSRIITILSHYGSRKNQLVINLVLSLMNFRKDNSETTNWTAEGKKWHDGLDIVNPYFRFKEGRIFYLEKHWRVRYV